jgi:hypothetical protein
MTEDPRQAEALERRVRERLASDALAAPERGDLGARARAAAGVRRVRAPRALAVAAAAVAVLAVAAGTTVWWTHGSDGPAVVTPAGDGAVPDEPGVAVGLPTSGWKPGDVSQQARLTGVVTVDRDGCIFASPATENAGNGKVGLLWPAGFTARREGDGRVSVLDGDGRVILREGDRFRVGGGTGAPGTGPTCLLGTTETWVMQATPEKVAGT